MEGDWRACAAAFTSLPLPTLPPLAPFSTRLSIQGRFQLNAAAPEPLLAGWQCVDGGCAEQARTLASAIWQGQLPTPSAPPSLSGFHSPIPTHYARARQVFNLSSLDSEFKTVVLCAGGEAGEWGVAAGGDEGRGRLRWWYARQRWRIGRSGFLPPGPTPPWPRISASFPRSLLPTPHPLSPSHSSIPHPSLLYAMLQPSLPHPLFTSPSSFHQSVHSCFHPYFHPFLF